MFALSLNFFNAVFNRISSRLQELAKCGDETADYSDIELIQHINVDVYRLTKLLNGSSSYLLFIYYIHLDILLYIWNVFYQIM